MATLQQNLQRPFYIKHLLERLRYGKAAAAMRREAAELIEKMNEDSSNLSAQNSAQAMQIDELKRDLAAAQEARQWAEERAQAWREKTHAAEDVALAALASFSLTQSVDDYPEDHWSHKAERIRTIRAAIDSAMEAK